MLPQTPNGKVDRISLARIDISQALARSSTMYVAPRNNVEAAVARAFADTLDLDLDQVGALDDFFELGGHSLRIIALLASVHASPGLAEQASLICVADVLKHRTVEALAVCLQKGNKEESLAMIERTGSLSQGIDSKTVLRVSSAQEQMAMVWSASPNSTTYNLPTVLSLESKLDSPALGRAIHHMVQRHESLRTLLRTDETGRWLQHVYPASAVNIDDTTGPNLVEWNDCTSNQHQDNGKNDSYRSILCSTAWEPFDLENGPTVRAALVPVRSSSEVDSRAHDEKFLFVLCTHHAFSDGLSHALLLRELQQCYSVFAAKGSSDVRVNQLPPTPSIQYPDYAAWQCAQHSSAAHSAQLKYWVDRLAFAPPLDMPLDKSRPSSLSGNGAIHQFVIDADLAARFKRLAARCQCTPFVAFLAAWKLLLCRYSRAEEIVVGVPYHGRSHPELHDVNGYFVNPLAMRVDVLGTDCTFEQLLHRVADCTRDAFMNADVQFHEVVHAVYSRMGMAPAPSPIFQTFFNYLNFDDAGVDSHDVDHSPAQFQHLSESEWDILVQAWGQDQGTTKMAYPGQESGARLFREHLCFG